MAVRPKVTNKRRKAVLKKVPVGRGRLIKESIQAMVLLRHGGMTAAELADKLDVHWRSVYRLLDAIRDAGITVAVEREERHGYFTIPEAPLRRLLRL